MLCYNNKNMETKELIKSLIDLNLTSKNFIENSTQKPFNLENKILFFIFCNKDCSPTDIIDKFKIKKTNLAIICKKLIDEGLIEKQKNTFDARALKYQTTTKADELINKTLDFAKNNTSLTFKKQEELCLLAEKMIKLIKN